VETEGGKSDFLCFVFCVCGGNLVFIVVVEHIALWL
jgi:hypothetical protein